MNIKIKKTPQSVEEYISNYPEEIRKRLRYIRTAIKKAAPDAAEKISYGMPAFTFKGMLLYFAAHTNHIGFYPYPSAMEAFKKEITKYRAAKGSMHFRHNEKLPLKLIEEIVKFRIQENIEKEELKLLKKKSKKK